MDTHESEAEPLSAPALVDLETPEPPVQPAAAASFFDNPHPDAAGKNVDAGGWNTVSWSTPAPACTITSGPGSGFGFGTAPAQAAVPNPNAEPGAFFTPGGQDAADIALQPDVAPTVIAGDGGEAEAKPREEQTQEQEQPVETQTETPAFAPSAFEGPEPQPEPGNVITPAAPAGDDDCCCES